MDWARQQLLHSLLSRSDSRSPTPEDALRTQQKKSTTSVQTELGVASAASKSNAWIWNPIWLRTSFLSATASTFFAFIAVLLLLLYFAKADDGLTLRTSNHFTWTYGPTAVLTIVVAAWRQIDYYCKALAPWDELYRGNAHPSKSVLLDYKSPLQIISFYNAAKNRHFTVIATILGFVVLKLITVASTGLLFPSSITVPSSQVEVSRITKLDGSLYDASANQGLFDPSIVYTAYAAMNKGLPYADGTTTEMVYEQIGAFNLPQQTRDINGTVSAEVRALVPTYHCESAPVAVNLQPANVTDLHPEDTLQLLFPECTLRADGKGTPVYALNPQTFVCPERQLSPLLQQIDCNTQTSPGSQDNWQLLTLTDFRYNQTIANASGLTLGDPISATAWSTGVAEVVGIACRSGFSIEKIQLSYDFQSVPRGIRAARTGDSNTTVLGNFTGFDLGVLTTSALSASADMFGNLVDNQEVLEYPNVLFKMMAAMSGGTYEDLLNEKTMITAAEKVLQQVALQSAAKYIVSSDNTTLPGTFLRNEERLQISDFSLWVMFSGSAVMALFTLFLLWKRPKNLCPHDPESSSRTAELLAHSVEFRDTLRRVGLSGDDEVNAKLQDFRFSAERRAFDDDDHVVSLALSSSSARSQDATYNNDISRNDWKAWWSPLTLKTPILVISLVIPLATVGALEAVQQVSDERHGFVAVPDSTDTSISIYTRFLPALLMLLVATMINALDFNIAVLAPYNALRSEDRHSLLRSITTSNLGHPPPLAIWRSLRHRQWGPFLSGIASLVASVLTIVVSGLYTVDRLHLSQTVSLDRSDIFKPNWINSVKDDGSAAVIASLTESLGLDYPQFTYGELALPSLKPVMSAKSDNEPNSTVQIRLPALRSDLQCVELASDMVNVSVDYNLRIETAQASVSAVAPLPPTCLFGGTNGTANYIQFSNTFTLRGNSSYVGKLLDLHVGPFDPIQDSSFGELSPNTQADNPPGCPSLAFVYGYADVNAPSRTAMTTLMCSQYIDQVSANVTFTWPDLAIPTIQPPVVNDSSAERLLSSADGETAFQFRLQLHMDDEFSSFNQTANNTSTLAESSSPLDNFFQGVLFGKQPLDISLLASSREADISQVFGGIRGFYRRYMAQAISSNMRVPPENRTTTVTGTLLDATVQARIVQDRTAKVILQVQLGLIFVLASLATYCSKLREILPFNPCTIAGVAALFAWSRMCDLDDPVGKGVMENRGKGLCDGRYRYRLGWWNIGQGGGETHKWYGIDAIKVEEEDA
ncbi:uncharacterized protein Z519_00719 [Cladophialophora bantiana CBS 173.52]|uniref:Uncharacterized protein n=1 Tax=Cladophialophora bantiana (strain ATCC 10958 / CBS 173.52 / CDC B-1940 / NIH 8579) TaxID=1442370 RepID=A0A0D2FAF0_CLAB1|nr:uncharacterized protein Z519_00719 [Cladophialophora bantiana CBS 173.52]KIW99056.1 hypothetical protein Z519_00719 [Cladophialophora bantiana CBS 173.52]